MIEHTYAHTRAHTREQVVAFTIAEHPRKSPRIAMTRGGSIAWRSRFHRAIWENVRPSSDVSGG